MQRGFLEVRRVGRKNLPARHWFAKHLNGAQIGELPPQTLVVLLGGGEPNSIVGRRVALVAEDQHNLVLHVDGEATKHGTRLGRKGSKRVEHELMRDSFAPDRKAGVIEREERDIATRLRHWEKS